ncbi:hypothetical protein [Eisenibacter elegans]|uniref:hypothetical protein n=1 Tax=Eisenibacter elegans TaxID=997 RepID=UPI00040FD217|nr:hypothetical protein [Eisenibacter elegans]
MGTQQNNLSRYYEFVYLADQKLFKMRWRAESTQITEEEFRKVSINYLKAIDLYRPVNVIIDARKLKNFVISPALRQWTAENVLRYAVEKGQRKVGVLVSPDLNTRASMAKAMSGLGNENLEVHYFDEEVELMYWMHKEE